jgi:GNAT superfamily N-acetyltransferase
VRIRPFDAGLQREVRDLIAEGLAEHFGSYDATRNPDLEDIAAVYAPGVFLVATIEGRLVGTGALVPETAGVGRIVRMSVRAAMRRRGIASAILAELAAAASAAGYRRLVLETTADWAEVIEFYRSQGFELTGVDAQRNEANMTRRSRV